MGCFLGVVMVEVNELGGGGVHVLRGVWGECGVYVGCVWGAIKSYNLFRTALKAAGLRDLELFRLREGNIQVTDGACTG